MSYWVERSGSDDDEAATRPLEALLETQFGMVPATWRDSAALRLTVRFKVETPLVPTGQASLDRLYRATLTVQCEHHAGRACPQQIVPAQRLIHLLSRRDAVDALVVEAIAELGRTAWRGTE
jgi:hypothetical protein